MVRPWAAAMLLLLGSLTIGSGAAPHRAGADGVVVAPVDIGNLGGAQTYVYAVNDAGQVVGGGTTATGSPRHAFIWDASNGMRDIGTLGGLDAVALGVTRDGVVYGQSGGGTATPRAFRWDSTHGMTDLGTLGGSSAYFYGMNDYGDAVGWSYPNGDTDAHAVLWPAGGGIVDLGTFGGGTWSTAIAVNNAGIVVGEADVAGGSTAAFIWDPVHHLRNIGNLGLVSDTEALAIDDGGNVYGTDLGASKAFIWTAAKGMKSLGTLGGTNSTITETSAPHTNGVGQTFGSAQLAGDGAQHGFVWSASRGMVDIGALLEPYSEIDAMNNAGQATGISCSDCQNSAFKGFVWDPTNGTTELAGIGDAVALPYGINNAGLVVGDVLNYSTGASRAVVWAPPGPDISPPSISIATPVDGAAYTAGSTVSADYSCTDTGSAVTQCFGSVANGSALSTSPGAHTFTVTAIDARGNLSTASRSYSVPDTVAGVVADTGGTIATTNPLTLADPVQSSVTSPTGGTVSISEGTATAGGAPTGYTLLGSQVEITAPQASAAQPLSLSFTVAKSALDASGTTVASTQILRDGTPVSACTDPSQAVASPDPCVFNRATTPEGDAQIGIYSSHASSWNVARAGGSAPTISVGDASIIEGDTAPPTLRFPVTINQSSAVPLTVSYHTIDGTAHAPSDYRAKTATLTIPANATTAYIAIPIVPNQIPEGLETFSVELSNPSGSYLLAHPDGTGTIIDDDPGSGTRLAISDATEWIGAGPKPYTATLTISLAGRSTTSVSVDVSLIAGTAFPATDYKAAATKTVTFLAGQTQKTVVVTLYPQTSVGRDKTLSVALSSPRNAVIARAFGTITLHT